MITFFFVFALCPVQPNPNFQIDGATIFNKNIPFFVEKIESDRKYVHCAHLLNHMKKRRKERMLPFSAEHNDNNDDRKGANDVKKKQQHQHQHQNEEK